MENEKLIMSEQQHPDLYIQYKATSKQKYMKTTQVSIKMYTSLKVISQNMINNGLKLWFVVFTVQTHKSSRKM